MKKAMAVLLSLLLFNSVVLADEQSEKEILFRDIPWGTSYSDVSQILSQFDLWTLTGDTYRVYPVNEIITDDQMEELQFEQNDINIYATASNKETDVAGYTTSDVELFFSYVEVDGTLTKSEEDSALYGARYTIEPQNLREASQDLFNKLTSLYGEPSEEKDWEEDFGYSCKYTYWNGANDTRLVLKEQKVSEDFAEYDNDKVILCYVWLKGDELLKNAEEILKQNAINDESAIYGNESVNGL